jgi:WD40 repeat protein
MVWMWSALGLLRRFARPLLAVALLLLLILGCRLLLPAEARYELAPEVHCGRLLAFSPDGKGLLLAKAVDGTKAGGLFWFWEPDKGPNPVPLRGGPSVQPLAWAPGSDAERVTFSADKATVAVEVGNYGTSRLCLWETATGELLAELPHYERAPQTPFSWRTPMNDFRFTPNGRQLVYAYRRAMPEEKTTSAVRCWDLQARQERSFPDPHFLQYFGLAADGSAALLVRKRENTTGNVAVLWRLTGGPDVAVPLAEYPLGEEEVVACNADLSAFVTATYPDRRSGTVAVKVWDTRTGKVRGVFTHTEPWQEMKVYLSFAFSPGGNFLVIRSEAYGKYRINSGPNHRGLALWDIRRQPVQVGRRDLAPYLSDDSIFSADDRRVVLATGARVRFHKNLLLPSTTEIELADTDTLDRIRTLADENPVEFIPWAACLTTLVISPDGNRIAAMMRRQPHTNAFLLWLSRYLPHIKADESPYVVRLREAEGGDELASFRGAWLAMFSPDGQSLAVLYEGGGVAIWDVPPRRSWPRVLGWAGLCWAVIVLLFWGLRRCRARWVSHHSTHPTGLRT